jgi:hypothetical protein
MHIIENCLPGMWIGVANPLSYLPAKVLIFGTGPNHNFTGIVGSIQAKMRSGNYTISIGFQEVAITMWGRLNFSL